MINQELDHEFMILDKFEKDFDNQINKSFGKAIFKSFHILKLLFF